MTAMTELTENTVLSGPVEPEESVTAAEKDETSLIESFENTLDISQDVEQNESAASEETDSREKPEQEDGQQDGEGDRQQDGEGDRQQDGQKDRQQDGQKDRQQDGQRDRWQDGEEDRQQDGQRDRQQDGQRDRRQDGHRDGQQDGQPVSPSAAESSSSELKWVVGAQCQAQWSEDLQVYPATVVSVDAERCRVRFNGYGNQQDMEVSALRSPKTPLQRQKDWKPGSLCRAVYSEDRLVYPAIVLWVKGQRCRVRFDDYNNEQEMDVGSLLSPNELHGPCRAKVKEKQSNQSKVEKDSGEKKRDGAEKPTNHCFSFFPPFPPPPPPSSSGDSVAFVPPPPPPLWSFSGRESAVDPSSSMLMLWYMCGFHTGSYMAQQGFKSSSKD